MKSINLKNFSYDDLVHLDCEIRKEILERQSRFYSTTTLPLHPNVPKGEGNFLRTVSPFEEKF